MQMQDFPVSNSEFIYSEIENNKVNRFQRRSFLCGAPNSCTVLVWWWNANTWQFPTAPLPWHTPFQVPMKKKCDDQFGVLTGREILLAWCLPINWHVGHTHTYTQKKQGSRPVDWQGQIWYAFFFLNVKKIVAKLRNEFEFVITWVNFLFLIISAVRWLCIAHFKIKITKCFTEAKNIKTKINRKQV